MPHNPVKLARAERQYQSALRQVARQVGSFIRAFDPLDPDSLPTMETLLANYAEALKPWAKRTALRMLAEVNHRDIQAWKATASVMSREINREILTADVGNTFRRLMDEQVGLITSIPLEAAKRLHKLTMEGFADSTRASEIIEEIKRSGHVADSRAKTIARTETSRTATAFTQARALHVGSQGYIWRTSKDADVRSSHKAMNGKFVRWDDPPTLDKLTGHAGCLPNCRCWTEVVVQD